MTWQGKTHLPAAADVAEVIARQLHYPEAFEQGDPERVIDQYLPIVASLAERGWIRVAEPAECDR